MPVGFATANLKGVFDGFDRRATFQEDTNAINDRLRETGNIGDGRFDDFVTNASRGSDEPGWFRVTVRNLRDVHGYIKSLIISKYTTKTYINMQNKKFILNKIHGHTHLESKNQKNHRKSAKSDV